MAYTDAGIWVPDSTILQQAITVEDVLRVSAGTEMDITLLSKLISKHKQLVQFRLKPQQDAYEKNVYPFLLAEAKPAYKPDNRIPINFGGDMAVCERPLRAETMQGPRVTLASSEEVPEGSTMLIKIKTMNIGKADLQALVREWLNYGELHGLGQWRNSGRGRFVWEELDDSGEVIGGNA